MSEWLAVVRDRLRPHATEASVDRITVGERAVLVELRSEDQTMAGLAHLPTGEPPETEGRTVESLLAEATTDVGGDDTVATEQAVLSERALGIATLNALSAPLVDWRRGDPMALLSDDVEQITTVGLFRPAFRKFEDVEVRVIERERIDHVPDPAGVRVRTFTPAAVEEAMADSEVVFITGSAFIYGGVEAYVEAAPPAATVVVIGATASFWPDPLFAAGVDAVAGAIVTDVADVRTALTDGACGTDLHESGLTKVYAARETPAGIRLDTIGGADSATTDAFSPTDQK